MYIAILLSIPTMMRYRHIMAYITSTCVMLTLCSNGSFSEYNNITRSLKSYENIHNIKLNKHKHPRVGIDNIGTKDSMTSPKTSHKRPQHSINPRVSQSHNIPRPTTSNPHKYHKGDKTNMVQSNKNITLSNTLTLARLKAYTPIGVRRRK